MTVENEIKRMTESGRFPSVPQKMKNDGENEMMGILEIWQKHRGFAKVEEMTVGNEMMSRSSKKLFGSAPSK